MESLQRYINMEKIEIIEKIGWYHIRVNDRAVGQLKVEFIGGGFMLYIRGFEIKKKYRGRGYGRKLLNRVLMDLNGYGHPYFLICRPKNKVALNLYLSSGLRKRDELGEYDQNGFKWLYLIPKGWSNIAFNELRFKKSLKPHDKDKR